MRQIVLDTETTGLEPEQGHRIIEIGCVEVADRELTGRHYHVYINPEREVEDSAIEVHGITNEFLADKPTFREIADEFLEFIRGAELIIHNAPFDVGFMDHEFGMLDGGYPRTTDVCGIRDSLVMARSKHPGQKNNLDVLCRRYGIDNSNRELHGALLDAEILALVYLAMTGGQTALSLGEAEDGQDAGTEIRRLDPGRSPLAVPEADEEELNAHRAFLDGMAAKTNVLWDEQGIS
ncbi:DNA polymerase III subunit epsilon [Halovibrio salipaludis]|jgi:DNA polymerase-3 subunit epsilon|uniref:DNA polymerase III subunit epsilon n=1 Tax=Halovibrio salipaludis TaxID=2032626 RepID=A0A2A2F882_9GAMM|nr:MULTISPECIES: DNA polymerase III subunit epsilon [Gammaproteobacteria]KAA8984575.1 DNA polymerase III subunit epsilon [Halospina sp. K52047b]PAU81030.1 DNA polymerase III subunit epsilon [Halovibrio salipaludis]